MPQASEAKPRLQKIPASRLHSGLCGEGNRCGGGALRGVNLPHAGYSYPGSRGRWWRVWRGYPVEGRYNIR